MSVKIRLARKGRKKLAYYHVVVADSRSPRDGRFIEKIGTYNPLTDPATIDINFEKALGWLQNGAQPTDTCRAILKYKGVMIKKHLLEGVKKGAFDEAEADRRFNEWLKGKEETIELKKSGLEKLGEDARTNRLEAETVVKEARAAEYARKIAALAAAEEAAAKAAAAPETVEEAPVEETTEAAAEPAIVEEAPAEKTVEAVAEPVIAEEAPAEEKTEAAAEPAIAEEAPAEKTTEAAAEPVAQVEAEAPAADISNDTAKENEKTE